MALSGLASAAEAGLAVEAEGPLDTVLAGEVGGAQGAAGFSAGPAVEAQGPLDTVLGGAVGGAQGTGFSSGFASGVKTVFCSAGVAGFPAAARAAS